MVARWAFVFTFFVQHALAFVPGTGLRGAGAGASRLENLPNPGRVSRAYQSEHEADARCANRGIFCGLTDGVEAVKNIFNIAAVTSFLSGGRDTDFVRDFVRVPVVRMPVPRVGLRSGMPTCLQRCQQFHPSVNFDSMSCVDRTRLINDALSDGCTSSCDYETKQRLWNIADPDSCAREERAQQSTTTSQPQCRTATGKACMFPFTFRGIVYNTCITEGDEQGQPWCSTKTDEWGNHVSNKGNWGHCNMQQTSCTDVGAAPKTEDSLAQDWLSSLGV